MSSALWRRVGRPTGVRLPLVRSPLALLGARPREEMTSPREARYAPGMKPTFSFLCTFIVAAPLLLPSCGVGAAQCPDFDLAAFSVTVTVVNDQNAVQTDAKVTFSVNGGPEQAAQCVSPSGSVVCASWTAGVEQTGMFTIKAASGDGMKHAQASVTVTSDECHVIGQTVKLTLM